LPAPSEADKGAAVADGANVGRRRAGPGPQRRGDAGRERPPPRRLEAIRGAARADGPGRASREADNCEEILLKTLRVRLPADGGLALHGAPRAEIGRAHV